MSLYTGFLLRSKVHPVISVPPNIPKFLTWQRNDVEKMGRIVLLYVQIYYYNFKLFKLMYLLL